MLCFSKKNKIFFNKENNSIKRTGENIIYYLNLQNKNKTSLDYYTTFNVQFRQRPVLQKSIEGAFLLLCPNVDPTTMYVIFI